jgi:nondiscriminating aspartyl-tRNA synthetase
MERIFARELPEHAGCRVRLAGWIHAQRRLSRHTFVVLRDGTGLAQLVVDGELRERVDALLPETVVEVEGDAVATPQAPGGVEVHAPTLRVLAEPAGPPPIELRRPRLREQLPTRLDHAPVALRQSARAREAGGRCGVARPL